MADPLSTSGALAGSASHDPYAALRLRDFRLYLIGMLVGFVGATMLSVAVGWELYERTHSPLALGVVGLVQVMPVLALALPAGQVVDRYDRRRVLMASLLLMAAAAAGLGVVSYAHAPVALMYVCILLVGVAGAFQGAARGAFVPELVPREIFSTAAAWASGGWQFASVVGPALGGVLISATGGATVVYATTSAAALVFVGLLAAMRVRSVPRTGAVDWSSLAAGVRFVRRTEIILAVITLDLFAVLLGGAVALLPVFAKDILHVGPSGLGVLQAAPSVGAVATALLLAHRPPLERAGPALLWAIAGFGAATIVFGLSTSFPLSLAMLFLTGAFDMVSVVVRQTVVPLLTPDEMRGRVSAVNSMFIGASNQLGGFESGVVAAAFGPVVSVVAGGIGTLLVVVGVAAIWPRVRQMGSLQHLTSE